MLSGQVSIKKSLEAHTSNMVLISGGRGMIRLGCGAVMDYTHGVFIHLHNLEKQQYGS